MNDYRPAPDITRLLIEWSNGDEQALTSLYPLIDRELQRIAKNHMRRIRTGNTIETAALINETYLHLLEHQKVEWQNRAHFFGVAAIIMRQFLLNYLRSRKRQKRGGGGIKVTLGDAMAISEAQSEEILALEDALTALERLDKRKARVVTMRYYGGLTVAECAEVLGVSEMTVIRDWNFAKAWLRNQME